MATVHLPTARFEAFRDSLGTARVSARQNEQCMIRGETVESPGARVDSSHLSCAAQRAGDAPLPSLCQSPRTVKSGTARIAGGLAEALKGP